MTYGKHFYNYTDVVFCRNLPVWSVNDTPLVIPITHWSFLSKDEIFYINTYKSQSLIYVFIHIL